MSLSENMVIQISLFIINLPFIIHNCYFGAFPIFRHTQISNWKKKLTYIMYIQIYIYIYPVYSDYILSMVGTSSIFTYTQTSYQVVSVKLSENVRFSMIIHTEVISIWNAHIYIYIIYTCV